MSSKDYKKLQNGSDIRGVALDGVEGEKVNLTSEAVADLIKGFSVWLKKKYPGKALTVAVGRDPRLSGEAIAHVVKDTLIHCGITVYGAGLASTPAMFFSTVFEEYNTDGAVMITASHLPWNRNGLKFFSKDGGLEKTDIAEIVSTAENEEACHAAETEEKGGSKVIPLMETYAASLRDFIIKEAGLGEAPLTGLKITVDAGNGAGGFFASKVLEPLGADVSSSRFLEPDGNFPNHAPNPEDEKAMEAICSQVKAAGTDLGLIFDTDVDRSSAVDENGKEINRNGIVALAAALIADKAPGSSVVTDSITSNELAVFLEEGLGLKHKRFKRGYRNVINEGLSLNAKGEECFLAIETSGHAAYKDNYFLDDGAYLAARITAKAAVLKKQGKGISSMIEKLKEPVDACEVRMAIKESNFAAYAGNIISDLEDFVSTGQMAGATLVFPNYEGVRVDVRLPEVNGWFLLRKSLHDPIMPLNVEADVKGGCAIIRKKLHEFLGAYEGLDISKL